MATVYSYSDSFDYCISVYLSESGRNGVYPLYIPSEDSEDNVASENKYSPEVLKSIYTFQRSSDESVRLECLQKIVDALDIHITNLPHIEDCPELLQRIYNIMNDPLSDDMYYIEFMSNEEFKKDWGMTKEDFIEQIESYNDLYHLNDVIDCSPYPEIQDPEFDDYFACVYPSFLEKFTTKDPNVRENEKSADISKESKKKNTPIVR